MIDLNLRRVSVGARFAVLACALAGAIVAGFTFAVTHHAGQALERRTLESIDESNRGIGTTIALLDKALGAEVTRYMSMFVGVVPAPLVLDESRKVDIGGVATPTLEAGGKPTNLDFSLPDEFLARSGAVSTLFARTGDDFVRVTTSLKKQDGSRAIGTLLDRKGPAYSLVAAGKPYIGLAPLFGRHYITKYQPMTDGAGRVIGAFFVGVDISAEMAALQQSIRAMKIGASGHYVVVDASDGPARGTLLVAPGGEGEVADERIAPFGRMLAGKEGRLSFDATASPDRRGGAQEIAFRMIPEWNWLVAGIAYRDELLAAVHATRDRFLVIGVVAIGLLVAVLLFAIGRLVSRPIADLTQASERLAAGDLSVRLSTARQDDIGRLMLTIDGIATGLASIVTQVREASAEVSGGTERIASDSSDISQLVTAQAGNVEETVASMGQITSTVQQNAAHTSEADRLVASASDAARAGGDAVARVVGTMGEINSSARRIADNASVIQSIAFQSSILALNAAVEAARAGEHGKGFAVVASEVRVLAQRSAGAAKEISSSIAESVAKVTAGTHLAEEARRAMAAIVDRVTQMSAIIGQISVSSQEQASGIEQVNLAMVAIGESTQKNAALVGDAERSTAQLLAQADTLDRAVSVFRI